MSILQHSATSISKLLDGGKSLDADLITLGLASANALHIGHQDGLIIFVCFHEFIPGWLHAPQPVSMALFWHVYSRKSQINNRK